MKPSFTLIPLLAIAAACGGSGQNQQNDDIKNNVLPNSLNVVSNEDILSKAYDPGYQVPAGFYIDERAQTETQSYTVHHVLDESASFERCSDDLVVATAWEQADNDARAVRGEYVTSIENDRYFEFVRELAYTDDIGNIGDPTSPGYARIFKCGYANRDGVDRSLLEGYSGRLSATTDIELSLREFVEYLWQFRFFAVSRKIVVDSFGDATADGHRHTLLLALVVNQGTDRCDRIDVIEWKFHRNAVSGEITRAFDTIRSFEGQLVNGNPQFCD